MTTTSLSKLAGVYRTKHDDFACRMCEGKPSPIMLRLERGKRQFWTQMCESCAEWVCEKHGVVMTAELAAHDR